MPWEALTAALVGGVPALLDEVRTMLAPVAPEYAEYLIEGRADVVVAAEAAMAAFVEHAQRCLSLTQSPDEVGLLPDTVLSMFEEVGRNQWSEGFALRTLLSAYQVGGRVAWHHVAATSLRSGVGAEALTALAEAVFYFVDELCAASTDGYVAAQTASVAEREHRRDILVELLLSDRSDSAALRRRPAKPDGPCRSGRRWCSCNQATRTPATPLPGWGRTVYPCATAPCPG
jgi:hypothetical protein